jgi:hypothetical protein
MSQRRVEIAPHVQFVRVEGDYVLMDLKGGVYLGLDPVASRIWQSLAEHVDLARAAADLCQDYDVALETALADVERWVAELEEKGLVYAAGPEATP